jgi:ribonuclease J
VDGVGLAIHTPVGTVVHTGDFKIDQTPIDGETTDFHKIAELGNKGVSLLMSDSTNVERPGYSLSEREIGEILREIFEASQDRIIVATFASNIHRIKQVAECTVQTGRKICLIGLSIVNTVKMARELKYLDFPDDLFVSPKDLETLPHKRTVILTTGSQGEPMSALSRMATDSHRFIRIKKGDTVVISARMIPGNEITISRTINSLFERGAEVIYEKVSDVHVSGHASQEELKLMLNLVRPKYFMPIHGEYRHLVHHGQIAERIGMAKDRVLILKNGTKVVLDKEGARISGKVRAGTILVDGKGVGDVGSVVLRDRQHLSQDGMVIVVITLNKQTGELLAGPDLVTRGFVYAPRADDLILKAKEKVFGVLKQAIDSKSANWSNLKSSVRQTLRKFLYEQTERRPMILPIIMEV